MDKKNEWFEIIELNDHLIVIREKLSEVDPRFLTEYTNMFLLLGSHSALLIDTGCGIFPIKPTIDSLIGDKKLIVINTHAHWDHVGGNHEFDEVYIHEDEANLVAKPVNLSLLKESSKEIVNRFNSCSFTIPPALEIKTLKEGDYFDLGGLTITIIHTPGHSIGSISLLTDKRELFTVDTAHI
ncbi:MAG: MBL fold metallo-hydrolase [Promethearchaeota archaeon]